ncbi:hypothetical protein ACQKGL_28950 [Ensifer adhaerens]|uniref:hypothetical protein n=1 Tax=Ensifer adhaerens TaxID=106592 RepID=UPI003CFD4E66
MSRRKQFKGICHDILATFASRYNDLNGYWALGQYVAFLNCLGERQIQFKLGNSIVVPDGAGLAFSAKYYRGAIFRMMEANAMPQAWFADATIRFSIVAFGRAACEIEVVSDRGRTYRSDLTIDVRPHDSLRERRRGGKFGPSNQKGR